MFLIIASTSVLEIGLAEAAADDAAGDDAADDDEAVVPADCDDPKIADRMLPKMLMLSSW
jgi:hypothetical protein